MTINIRLLPKIIIIGLLAVIVLSASSSMSANALMGRDKCYDTTTKTNPITKKKTTTKTWTGGYEGYFTGDCESSKGNSDVINGGIKSSVDTAKELIDKLHSWYDGGGQNKTGAAFIVKTMLGKDADGGGRKISSSEWNDIEARITALDGKGAIDWNTTVQRCDTNSYYSSRNNDDFFYKRDSGCGKDSAIKFKKGSSTIYVLDRDCANPIGSIGALPKPDWKISTNSSLKSFGNLLPEDTITWSHTITNKGLDDLTSDVKYRYENTGSVIKSGINPGWVVGDYGSDWTLSTGTKKDTYTKDSKGKTTTSSYTITANDAGNTLCRETSAAPKAVDDNGRTTSNDKPCKTIPYSYDITPAVTPSVSGTIEANTSFDVMPSITKTGVTRTAPTQWQMTQVVVLPENNVPNKNGGTSPQLPCGTYFKALPNASCSTIESGNTTFNANGSWQSGTVLTSAAITTSDYEVGTQICYALSVQPHSSSDNQWMHSKPICLIIGKKPKVQIWGGDLTVGGLVQTSTSVKNIGGQHVFGSWDEYGIFAVNSINGMGSGSAFAGSGLAIAGTTITSTDICNFSTLSFTNAGSTTCKTPGNTLGKYVTLRTNPDVAVSFPVNALDLVHNLGNNPSIDLSVGGLQGTYGATGTVSITGGGTGKVVAKGQWIVINVPDSDVTITDNIYYTSEPLATINDIPQVIIIAKDINILDTVINVDAWLIAIKDPNDLLNQTGIINTCSSVAPPLSSKVCKDQLTVNGPVMANKLYLRRTAGSGTGGASGDPAELFNMRPDAYMWAYARASSSGHIQTVKTTELPPRF